MQQVSSYLLQWFICQKDPPSVRGRVWQDTPGNSASKRGTQLGGRLLCLCHFSLNCRTASEHRLSAHTHCSGPSITCKGTVHLRGSGSLLLSVKPDWETNQSNPFYIFLESTFKKTFRLFMYQSHTFRGRDTPSQVFWI